MATRGRRKKLTRTMYTKAKRTGQCRVGDHKIRGYKVTRRKGKGSNVRVTYSVRSYCRQLAAGTKDQPRRGRVRSTRKAARGTPCYTKTGIKKASLARGGCPSGSNRTRANKDAGTGREGGFANRRSTGRRAGSGFVCVSKKTGRWTRKVAGGGCRKGSKRSKRF